MLTQEQIVTIHANAQKILSVCPPVLLENVLSILEQTEPIVKEIKGLRWQEEADGSSTLTYNMQKMGRVSKFGSSHYGPSYRGVIIHEYDPKTDSDETQVYLGLYPGDGMATVENNVRNILAARGEVLHV